VVSLAFGAAGVAKLARGRAWRRLASYGLPPPAERCAIGGAALEPGIARAPFLGLAAAPGSRRSSPSQRSPARSSWAGSGSARVACGCFGAAAVRDYRLLLARNARSPSRPSSRGGTANAPPDLGVPSGRAVPATLVVLGLALAAWPGSRRRSRRIVGAGGETR
jgi:hypothetical protein